MWLLDQWAERHILDAQRNGDFDALPGSGKPIHLDDDSLVPHELRAGYRLLKNSGCLPPELLQRKEALALKDLLAHLSEGDPHCYELNRRLTLLELKLQQAGLNTDFLHSEYTELLLNKVNKGS